MASTTRRTTRSILLAVLACAACSVQAQTCDAPLLPRAEPMLSTTCGGDLSITSICNGEITIAGPGEIWQVIVGTGASATLALAQPDWTFTPVGYLLDAGSGCGQGDCHARVDPMNPLQLADVPPGRYHLLVTGSEWNPPGSCGTYELAITGDLGDFDLVFANGFD
ncbi:MAG: hypothetical protein EOP90_10435 [Lysobacteraceae bacterium]|nr:MAG: hypothetical protein EOP90_10435 [Xanthomonadaceae bacterium]